MNVRQTATCFQGFKLTTSGIYPLDSKCNDTLNISANKVSLPSRVCLILFSDLIVDSSSLSVLGFYLKLSFFSHNQGGWWFNRTSWQELLPVHEINIVQSSAHADVIRWILFFVCFVLFLRFSNDDEDRSKLMPKDFSDLLCPLPGAG